MNSIKYVSTKVTDYLVLNIKTTDTTGVKITKIALSILLLASIGAAIGYGATYAITGIALGALTNVILGLALVCLKLRTPKINVVDDQKPTVSDNSKPEPITPIVTPEANPKLNSSLSPVPSPTRNGTDEAAPVESQPGAQPPVDTAVSTGTGEPEADQNPITDNLGSVLSPVRSPAPSETDEADPVESQPEEQLPEEPSIAACSSEPSRVLSPPSPQELKGVQLRPETVAKRMADCYLPTRDKKPSYDIPFRSLVDVVDLFTRECDESEMDALEKSFRNEIYNTKIRTAGVELPKPHVAAQTWVRLLNKVECYFKGQSRDAFLSIGKADNEEVAIAAAKKFITIGTKKNQNVFNAKTALRVFFRTLQGIVEKTTQTNDVSSRILAEQIAPKLFITDDADEAKIAVMSIQIYIELYDQIHPKDWVAPRKMVRRR